MEYSIKNRFQWLLLCFPLPSLLPLLENIMVKMAEFCLSFTRPQVAMEVKSEKFWWCKVRNLLGNTWLLPSACLQ